MDSESVKAIELSGIVHNATKIGVQDGDCEDLVNLRFKDGSWRASGDGKHVFSMQYQSDVANTNGLTYTQLYIHTNVYRHILGVRAGRLYWFGNIDADGVFEALDTPVELTTVSGDLYICQTGHLLTIIDDAGGFEHLLFKTSEDDYKKIQTSTQDTSDNREMFPYGMIHFNMSRNLKEDGTSSIFESRTENNGFFDGICDPNNEKINLSKDWYRNNGTILYGNHKKANRFTRPFLVCAAIKLYDGSYLYASPITFLYPNEKPNTYDTLYLNGYKTLSGKVGDYTYNENGYGSGIADEPSFSDTITEVAKADYNKYQCVPVAHRREGDTDVSIMHFVFVGGEHTELSNYQALVDAQYPRMCRVYKTNTPCTFSAGAHIKDSKPTFFACATVMSFDLVVSINKNFIKDNSDIFKSLCIFVTPEVDNILFEDGDEMGYQWVTAYDTYNYYRPKIRTAEQIANDLMNQPFYLLKEYDANSINTLINNPIVDLTSAEEEGLLENLTQQPTLTTEAFKSYETYSPAALYNYNSRLHIANYKRQLFRGYPIDMFQLNNNMLKYNESSNYLDLLPHLKLDELDKYMQFQKNRHFFVDVVYQPRDEDEENAQWNSIQNFIDTGAYFVLVKVYIREEIAVCRTINAYQIFDKKENKVPDFIEDLPPLLTYPDPNAYKMDIIFIQLEYNSDPIVDTFVYVSKFSFDLKPATYLGIAYYIKDNLHPISLSRTSYSTSKEFIECTGIQKAQFDEKDPGTVYGKFLAALEQAVAHNDTEDYPNGLKVSKTNNPLYFPVENTYQVGSSEVVAMMSNSVAVGTGQTGSAPLYIFCKDGVYAIFVDEKGEMAYTNSRVIARDVCNNAKSVTPIDSGVVFTTDRGLISIAGDKMLELGQVVEGDVFDYNNTTDKAKKIMHNAFTMRKLADLPTEMLDNVDFLTFLKGSIINYNHNERELMVSNNEKDANGNRIYNYSYIMDRHDNWSRRDIAADEYVNNYPTSYRVQDGEWYQVDKESEADNGIFAMSHVLKLDSIGFKELHRVVARGYFETLGNTIIPSSARSGVENNSAFVHLDTIYSVKDDINLLQDTLTNCFGRTYILRIKNKSNSPIVIGLSVKRGKTEETYLKDYMTAECPAQGSQQTYIELGNHMIATRMYLFLYSNDPNTNIGQYDVEYSLEDTTPSLGLYIFGSYDGRKWALLGHREKSGDFRDIGALVERTDCRFFRFVLAGQVSKDSRFDYFEVSSRKSKLNGKIR